MKRLFTTVCLIIWILPAAMAQSIVGQWSCIQKIDESNFIGIVESYDADNKGCKSMHFVIEAQLNDDGAMQQYNFILYTPFTWSLKDNELTIKFDKGNTKTFYSSDVYNCSDDIRAELQLAVEKGTKELYEEMKSEYTKDIPLEVRRNIRLTDINLTSVDQSNNVHEFYRIR